MFSTFFPFPFGPQVKRANKCFGFTNCALTTYMIYMLFAVFFVDMFTNIEKLRRNGINDGKNATVRFLEGGKGKIDLS